MGGVGLGEESGGAGRGEVRTWDRVGALGVVGLMDQGGQLSDCLSPVSFFLSLLSVLPLSLSLLCVLSLSALFSTGSPWPFSSLSGSSLSFSASLSLSLCLSLSVSLCSAPF